LCPTPILALKGSVIKSLQGQEADITFKKTDLKGIYLPMQLTDWLFVEVALQSLRQNRALTLILTAMAGKKLPNM
jgi:hypothetical protein